MTKPRDDHYNPRRARATAAARSAATSPCTRRINGTGTAHTVFRPHRLLRRSELRLFQLIQRLVGSGQEQQGLGIELGRAFLQVHEMRAVADDHVPLRL
jgi:hypothetical protein